MKYLYSIARGLNAAYRILLLSWLLYTLSMQFKHRQDIMKKRGYDSLPPRY